MADGDRRCVFEGWFMRLRHVKMLRVVVLTIALVLCSLVLYLLSSHLATTYDEWGTDQVDEEATTADLAGFLKTQEPVRPR